MNEVILAAFLAATLTPGMASADVVGGMLVADELACNNDHMIFYTEKGYVQAEWYRGSMHEGRVYFAEFHAYGLSDVYNEDGDGIGRIYVDDYWMSETDAAEYCHEG